MPATVNTPTKDDWDTLGLRPDVSVADVKAAWRRLSRQAHPDAGGTDALFRRVNDAYKRVIADAEWRERHVGYAEVGSEPTVLKQQADEESRRRRNTASATGLKNHVGQATSDATSHSLSSLVRLLKRVSSAAVELLDCAAFLCWQVLKLVSALLRWLMYAGVRPCLLKGTLCTAETGNCSRMGNLLRPPGTPRPDSGHPSCNRAPARRRYAVASATTRARES